MISRFVKSVGYALKGVQLGIWEERNVRVDIVAMLFVWRFSLFYNFTSAQYAILAIVTFAVPAFELMNTAVERAVHKPDKEHYMPAGAAKDAAAGGVLIMALGAVVAGFFMFWDTNVFLQIWQYYTTNFIHIGMLIFALIGAYFFITIDTYLKKD